MPSLTDMLAHYSIEATVSDAAKVCAAAADMPRPAAVFVPYLDNESDRDRIAACAMIRAGGLEPVPHLAARRIASRSALDDLLKGLREEAGVKRLFLIAGDVARPDGPYADSLAVIETGLLGARGIRQVGIAGHPDGHPQISEEVIWRAMHSKLAALEAQGLTSEVVTQFSFDAHRVCAWLHDLRAQGIAAPVRLGIAGPARVRTLLAYAARCGVSASKSVFAKYGLSLTRLLGSTGPDAFLAQLAADLDDAVAGEIMLHIFPFGGFDLTRDWLVSDASLHAPAAMQAA